MQHKSGIRKITFLSGKLDEERDNSFLRRDQNEGTDLYLFIEKEKLKGIDTLNQQSDYLLSLVIEADDLANNDSLSLGELYVASIKLKRYRKRLNNIVYQSLTTDPDASLFVNEFKVEEHNYNTFIVNEGLNNKIHDLYISKIPSIENSISIIETRIEYAEKNISPDTEQESPIPALKRPRSILLLLQECGMLKPFYEYSEKRGLKAKQMGKLLSLITGVGKEVSAFRNDIPSIIYDVKNSNGEFVKNEDAINTLAEEVFKSTGIMLKDISPTKKK